MDNSINVYLARHGQTQLNSENCFRGSIDVPLDMTGISDSHVLAKYLSNVDFDRAFCSDRKRAVVTAKNILKGRSTPLDEIPSLRAWNLGIFSGKPKDKYGPQLEYYVQNPNIDVPNGESLNAFRARVRPLIFEALELSIAKKAPVLLISHSSVIHEAGEMFNQDDSSALVKPGGVAGIYIGNGKAKVKSLFKPDIERHRVSDQVS